MIDHKIHLSLSHQCDKKYLYIFTRVKCVDLLQFLVAVVEEGFVKVGVVPAADFLLNTLGRGSLLHGHIEHRLHLLVVNVLLPPFRRNVRGQVLGELHLACSSPPPHLKTRSACDNNLHGNRSSRALNDNWRVVVPVPARGRDWGLIGRDRDCLDFWMGYNQLHEVNLE